MDGIIPDDSNKKNVAAAIKKWAKMNLAGNSYSSPIGTIMITMKGIKEALNQPHKFKAEKDDTIYILPSFLKSSIYIASAGDAKSKVRQYHYLEIIIKNSSSYLVIKETWEGENTFIL